MPLRICSGARLFSSVYPLNILLSAPDLSNKAVQAILSSIRFEIQHFFQQKPQKLCVDQTAGLLKTGSEITEEIFTADKAVL
ncbi:hypothetical protein chiPu_0004961 [Chiloscyllium punctatum]|uniref:Uncharacterized protein n=1 Tax=Chiloscyllium punctatum TaxID=137246 RepID=A0A401S818_CHIPU|nr:hypothetical protein [Chiloscyllium punctatum]